MPDQKNQANTPNTQEKNKAGQQSKPQDSNRPGGDAARTTATGKPHAKPTEESGRATKPDVKAQKK